MSKEGNKKNKCRKSGLNYDLAKFQDIIAVN